MWHGHVLILTSFLTRFPAFQTNQLFDPCQYATTAISNSSTQSTTTLKRLVANMSTWPPSVIGHYNRWESKPNIVQCDLDTNHHIVIDENHMRWCPSVHHVQVAVAGGLCQPDVSFASDITRVPWAKNLMIQATRHKSKSWEKQKERKRTNSEVIIGEFHSSPMGHGTALYILS